MSDDEKAQVVLVHYQDFYPKSLNPSLTPHTSLAPNHPNFDPAHADDQILREMNAADYCDWVKFIVRKMNVFGRNMYGVHTVGIYSAIIYNKYIVPNEIHDAYQCRMMGGISRVTFWRKMRHAFKLFGEIMPDRVLIHLYKMATNGD